MKIIKWFLLGLGFYLLYLVVDSVGVRAIASNIVSIRWKLLPVLLIYPFIYAFNTLGWATAFPKSLPRHVPFGDLYRIRIIGETFNCLIPWAASLGGEPIKVELLKQKHGIPLSEGYASILIVHTTFWVSLNIFLGGAVAVTYKTLPLTPILKQCLMIFLSGLAFVSLLLIAGLHLGIFKKIHALGDFFKWWGTKSEEKGLRYFKLDEAIKRFYTANKRLFFLSSFFNFLAWFTGTFEVYFVAKILGLPVGFSEAWLLEAMIQLLRIVTFFIPSSIGAQEGGIMLLFSEFGFAHPVSLTFAIIRRMREILWIGMGLLLWASTNISKQRLP